MVKNQESNREALIAASRRAEAPILAELAQLGFQLEWVSDLYRKLRSDIFDTGNKILQVEQVSDLYRKPIDYRAAIPTLIKWLPLVDDRAVKMELVDALSIKWAKPAAARPLIEEFREAPSEDINFKWAIANALSVVADVSVFDDIVELVRDKRHGRAREMLAVALANMKDPRAVMSSSSCSMTRKSPGMPCWPCASWPHPRSGARLSALWTIPRPGCATRQGGRWPRLTRS